VSGVPRCVVLPLFVVEMMTHKREKSVNNGQFFSDEFCRPIKIGRFHDTCAQVFLADFFAEA